MERVATEDGPTAHSPPSQPATGHLSSRLPWFCRESWGGGGAGCALPPPPSVGLVAPSTQRKGTYASCVRAVVSVYGGT